MNEDSHRARSQSPTKRRPGLRWKEKRRDDDDTAGGDDKRRLDRAYRDRSDRNRSPHKREGYEDSDRKRDSSRDRQTRLADHDERKSEEHKARKREKKQKKAAAAAQAAEPMIVVNVNDRLGTKAAIPCLASDPISSFPTPSIHDS